MVNLKHYKTLHILKTFTSNFHLLFLSSTETTENGKIFNKLTNFKKYQKHTNIFWRLL